MYEALDKYKGLAQTEDTDGWRWYGSQEDPFSYIGNTTMLGETVKDLGLEGYYKHSTAAQIERTLELAAEFGTTMHKLCEANLEGYGVDLPESHAEHNMVFREWAAKNCVEKAKLEFPVCSEKYGYAGTVDFLGRVNDKLYILDWKTGNNFRNSWRAQIAGYHLAVCETLGLDRLKSGIGMGILQIPRDNPKSIRFWDITHTEWVHKEFLTYLHAFKFAPRFNKLAKMKWKYLHEEIFDVR